MPWNNKNSKKYVPSHTRHKDRKNIDSTKYLYIPQH